MDEVNESRKSEAADEVVGPLQQQYEQQPPVTDDQIKKRQEQALMFEKYLDESGISLSFQIVFTEIIQKQIPEEQVFAYTAMRLRQIGKELEKIDAKAVAPKA